MVKHIFDKDTFNVRFIEESLYKETWWSGWTRFSWVEVNLINYEGSKIKYTKYQLSIIKLPINVKSVIIGIILSDGHIVLASRSTNAYLIFTQFLAKSAYILFLIF